MVKTKKEYYCDNCGKIFKQKGHLKSHMERKYPCKKIENKIVEDEVNKIIQEMSEKGEIKLLHDKSVETKPSTLYTFLHGDCLGILKTQPEKSVDIVITSPPYNIGIKYHDYNDKKSRESYLEWIR